MGKSLLPVRAHFSDGHLYAGAKVRQFQNKHYFLVSSADRPVFLKIFDAEKYCQEHGYDPDEYIKSGDPEIWRECINTAIIKSRALKEQADILNKLLQATYKETERLAEIRDRNEAGNRRNFDRALDRENVMKSVAKGEGLYQAYKNVRERYWYYEQIVMFAKKP